MTLICGVVNPPVGVTAGRRSSVTLVSVGEDVIGGLGSATYSDEDDIYVGEEA